jgi:CheY-like chemotaxis protein
MMPSRWGIDGFELCRLLKKNLGKNCPKIILHSAILDGQERDPEELRRQLRADAFLVKPVDLPEVWHAIEDLYKKESKK